MPAPPVQYVKTSDGYSIAYTVQGEGQTLVVLPFAFSHAQAVWTSSSVTPLLQALSQQYRVVYYDGRGQGLSQRGLPPDLTVDSLCLDLQAILETAVAGKAILLADNPMSHLAVRFTIEHPAQFEALVLMHCPVSLVAQIGWVSNMARQNWEYFLRTNAGLAAPGSNEDLSRRTTRAEGLKARTTQEDFLRLCGAFAQSDLSDELPELSLPTLVLHTQSQGFVTQEQSAATAALIPNGRLALVGGATFFGEPNEVVSAIEAFLSESETVPAPAQSSPTTRLSAREIEVLRLLAAGKSNQQIADELVISLNTVNRHVSNVYAKSGAANRAEAVGYAHRHGLAR